MLKYHFTAIYKDGSTYKQNEEDVSTTDPKRSCYFDVKQEELKAFMLYDEHNVFLVNLENGSFEINGVLFVMHEGHVKKVSDGRGGIKEIIVPLTDFRLVFFRRHTHSFLVGNEKNEEMSHEIVYRMGWQCTVEGVNYQEVMQFI